MKMWFFPFLLMLNVLASGLVIYDKWAAQRNNWRIKERTLILFAIMGGSPGMLLTMRLIRHKTRHPKFMVGLPLIIALQLFLVWFYRDIIF